MFRCPHHRRKAERDCVLHVRRRLHGHVWGVGGELGQCSAGQPGRLRLRTVRLLPRRQLSPRSASVQRCLRRVERVLSELLAAEYGGRTEGDRDERRLPHGGPAVLVCVRRLGRTTESGDDDQRGTCGNRYRAHCKYTISCAALCSISNAIKGKRCHTVPWNACSLSF